MSPISQTMSRFSTVRRVTRTGRRAGLTRRRFGVVARSTEAVQSTMVSCSSTAKQAFPIGRKDGHSRRRRGVVSITIRAVKGILPWTSTSCGQKCIPMPSLLTTMPISHVFRRNSQQKQPPDEALDQLE